MDDVFSLIFQGVASMIEIMDTKFVFSVGGFSFSLWQFEIACFLLALIVPVLLITRSQRAGTRSSVSERSPDDEEVKNF